MNVTHLNRTLPSSLIQPILILIFFLIVVTSGVSSTTYTVFQNQTNNVAWTGGYGTRTVSVVGTDGAHAPYEGVNQYKVTYTTNAGMQFAFSQQNLTSSTHLRLAIKGPITNSAQFIKVRLYASNGTYGPLVSITRNASYSVVDIPMSSLSSGLDLTQVYSLYFYATAAPVGTSDSFYLDNILFFDTAPTATATSVYTLFQNPTNNVAWTGGYGTKSITVVGTDGAHVPYEGANQYKVTYTTNAGMQFAFGSQNLTSATHLRMAIKGPITNSSQFVKVRLFASDGTFGPLVNITRNTAYSLVDIPMSSLTSGLNVAQVNSVYFYGTAAPVGTSDTFYLDNVLFITTATQPPPVGGLLTATRTSGPAPLAVQFDATAMGAFNGTYTFNFGDAGSGVWGIDGMSKNTQTGGPIAAHVFNTPGTYTVSVGSSEVSITVQDPNVVYSGANTICVSPSGDFTGSPSGAVTQTVLPTSYANKRVLLHRGESFGTISPLNTDSNFQVGAYGTGAKPNVAGVFTGMVGGVAAWTNNWTVMDLNIGAGCVGIDATTARFLLYRNDIKTPGGADSMVNIGTAAGYYQSHGSGPVPSSIYWPKEVFIVDNDIQGVVNSAGNPNLVVMGFFHRSAIMGNTIDHATEHSMRIWAAAKLCIAHNRIGGNHYAPNPPGIRGAVKIHSSGVQPFTNTIATSLTPASSQLLLSNNFIGSTTYPGSFLSGFGPQNADPGTVEGLEDCMAENNIYIRGPYTSSELQVRGRRITARGNTIQGGGTPNISRSGATFDPGLDAWDGPYFLQ